MKQKIFRRIADLRFCIFILLLISFFSILGTIIEQDQLIETYKENYPLTNPVFGFLTWDRILKFGLNHVYKTWWFFTLISLFGLSLMSCTVLQQVPSFNMAKRCQFIRIPEPFYLLDIFIILNNFSFNEILERLEQKQYSIFHQKNITYCMKGLNGRIGPILVHLSMLLILFGIIVSSLFGFKAQELVPKTESFHIQNLLGIGQLTFVPKTSARINDFWITYSKNKTVSQFYSDISILNSQGNEIARKTISVNEPLIHKNIYYYQTDWDLIGLRFQNIQNQTVEYPLVNLEKKPNKAWVTWISTNKFLSQGIMVIVDNLEGYCSFYSETGKFLGNIEMNETVNFQIPFMLLEILSLTGLQIKNDPGISIIYSGFGFLILTTLISYIRYSQIWMLQKDKKLFIGGTTNRGDFDFELEFFELILNLN